MAKDLKSYQRQYYNILHFLNGSQTPPLINNINYDNFILKINYIGIFFLIIIFILIYMYL